MWPPSHNSMDEYKHIHLNLDWHGYWDSLYEGHVFYIYYLIIFVEMLFYICVDKDVFFHE